MFVSGFLFRQVCVVFENVPDLPFFETSSDKDPGRLLPRMRMISQVLFYVLEDGGDVWLSVKCHSEALGSIEVH